MRDLLCVRFEPSLRGLGIQLHVNIDAGQNAYKVKPFVDAEGWEYEVLLDPNSEFKKAMNINMIPAVFLLDGNGKIVAKHNSYTDGGEQELYKEIKALVE